MTGRQPKPFCVARAGLLALMVPCLAAAQQWSVEELRDRCEGFHEPGVLPRLQEIAELVTHQEHAFAAICVTIQGDHKEYQLRIEKLLDQLADERWLAREDAERTLIEVGGRGLAQIQERADSAETLEEQIRAQRVLESIAARGTEAEQAELRLLRGVTEAASYLRPDPRLTRALLSALEHTDPLVRENVARALGRSGDPDVSARLAATVRQAGAGAQLRLAALAGLGRLAGAPAHDAIREVLTEEGLLRATEMAALLREVARRPDAGPLLEELAGGDTLLATMARYAREAEVGGRAREATFELSGDVQHEALFAGMSAIGIEAAEAVRDLEIVELTPSDCHVVDLTVERKEPSGARLFLLQGSLLFGELVSVDEDNVRFRSPSFGELELSRAIVQGLAVDPALDRMVGASSQHDRVRLREGNEFVDGRLVSMSAEEVVVERGGEEQRFDIADVAGVMFRRPAQSVHDPELYTRFELSSGDRVLAHVVAAGPGGLAIVVPGIGGASLPVGSIVRLEAGVGGGAVWGFTLVADYAESRVLEVDDQGREVFAIEEVYGAFDAECLDNGNVLITEFSLNRIVEVTRAGEEVWSFDELRCPYDADRLPNGNTLIADTFNDRVLEVAPDRRIVWELDLIKKPYDVDRLPNGNTLIADGRDDRVVEVTPAGEIVWSIDDLKGVHDADRLPNGNTLVTQRTALRVVEFDREGNQVFVLEGLSSPSDADRLPNGNTLVAENGWVREFDRRGQVVWERPIAWAMEVNRY